MGARSLAALSVAASLGMACAGERESESTTRRGLPCEHGVEVKVAAPKRGISLGAYPPLRDRARPYGSDARRLGIFRRLSGRRAAWAIFADVWFKPAQIRFPAARISEIWNAGSVPRVYLWPVSGNYSGTGPDPLYTLDSIIAGRFDRELARWAREARRSGIPIMVEFGAEANGGFPWSAANNGGGETRGYGDPAYPDGAERFRDAYRHVVDLMRSTGARNLTFSFHVVPDHGPAWNRFRLYYPGDRWVDWIGASVYGTVVGQQRIQESFRSAMDRLYPALAALSTVKPLAVLELGADEGARPGEKARWISRAFGDLRASRWPRVKAALWWNETVRLPPNPVLRLRIDSAPASLEAFRRAVRDPFFRDRATFRCGDER
jgi:Glycosyl hydrolase family 26